VRSIVNPGTILASDAAVRRELWTSFRSLLHAYVAAGSMGVEVTQALVVDGAIALEGAPGTMSLLGVSNTVKLALHFETGEGYWAIFGGERTEGLLPDAVPPGGILPLDEGQFRLGLDGLFAWSGKQGQLEMDAIAEALAMIALESGAPSAGPQAGPPQGR
jgi:hypothetical protein